MMTDPHLFLLFLAAALALLVTPGPAVIFVVTRSLQHGARAGLMVTLGLSCGGLVHVLVAVVGLNAVVATSAAAFNVIKLAGAAYLLYLAFQALQARNRTPVSGGQGAVPLREHFLDGFVVNVLNPKPAIFFFAFLPQFVDPAAGPVQGQLVLLGMSFVALGLLTDAAYAILANSVRRRLIGHDRFSAAMPYGTAAVYLALGVAAALTGRGKG